MLISWTKRFSVATTLGCGPQYPQHAISSPLKRMNSDGYGMGISYHNQRWWTGFSKTMAQAANHHEPWHHLKDCKNDFAGILTFDPSDHTTCDSLTGTSQVDNLLNASSHTSATTTKQSASCVIKLPVHTQCGSLAAWSEAQRAKLWAVRTCSTFAVTFHVPLWVT